MKLDESYPKCQGCGKTATYNIQTQWHRYSIEPDKQGYPSYTEEKSWEGDDNEFWCDKCAEDEGLI